MKLLTKIILSKTPLLYKGEGDKLITAKFFTPDSGWSWFLAEYDPINQIAFGYVVGFESEWGYFSIPEIESLKGPMGLTVERDRWFTPRRASEIDFQTA